MPGIDFSADELGDAIDREVATIIRSMVTEGAKVAIRESPVATGAFRSQWSVGRSFTALQRPTESTAATLARIKAAIAQYRRADRPIHLVNVADYGYLVERRTNLSRRVVRAAVRASRNSREI